MRTLQRESKINQSQASTGSLVYTLRILWVFCNQRSLIFTVSHFKSYKIEMNLMKTGSEGDNKHGNYRGC